MKQKAIKMKNYNDNRYILERYKSGGGNRYVCPSCGRKRCFTRYVDTETGEYLGEECGKCDHTSSCGYHCPPRDFFHDHPEVRPHDGREYVNGQPLVLHTRRSSIPVPKAEPRHQTEFFDISWAERAMQRTSTFRLWMETLPLDAEVLKRVMADYYVGGTAKGTVVDGIDHGPAVVFWLIDEQGRAHDAKLMAYHADGHRVKGWAGSMRSVCERTGKGPQLAETEKVLFGLHLLPRYPHKTVCIVESEKTALLCACHYPSMLWLATGGCGNLQAEKLVPLRDRRVVVYPDSGEYGDWMRRMERSGCRDYKVVDFMEQYESNTDIADILLGEARQKPEIFLPPPTMECPF